MRLPPAVPGEEAPAEELAGARPQLLEIAPGDVDRHHPAGLGHHLGDPQLSAPLPTLAPLARLEPLAPLTDSESPTPPESRRVTASPAAPGRPATPWPRDPVTVPFTVVRNINRR